MGAAPCRCTSSQLPSQCLSRATSDCRRGAVGQVGRQQGEQQCLLMALEACQSTGSFGLPPCGAHAQRPKPIQPSNCSLPSRCFRPAQSWSWAAISQPTAAGRPPAGARVPLLPPPQQPQPQAGARRRCRKRRGRRCPQEQRPFAAPASRPAAPRPPAAAAPQHLPPPVPPARIGGGQAGRPMLTSRPKTWQPMPPHMHRGPTKQPTQ